LAIIFSFNHLMKSERTVSIPIHIPDSLKGQMTKDTDRAKWLEQLPDILAACARHWDLTIETPMTEEYAIMSYNCITPARQTNRSEVILKIGPRDQGEDLIIREGSVLKLCNGRGTVKLLGDRPDLGALLLERVRPGTPLGLQTNDEENTRIAVRVMKRFWQPVPESHSFFPMSYEMDGFQERRIQNNGSTAPLPSRLVERAEAYFAELTQSSTEAVVLHGDLHHWNILKADREPWLAIDPKGYFGDPGYEVGAFLANHPDASCDGLDKRTLETRRIDVLVEELGFERERIIKWALILAMIWARWSIESNHHHDGVIRSEIYESLH